MVYKMNLRAQKIWKCAKLYVYLLIWPTSQSKHELSEINSLLTRIWGTRQRRWLRHHATSRKVAGSISDEFIGFFNLPNPSSRNIVLGWTQPITEKSTRNLPGR
jgi:hypothetical protein